MTSEAPATAVAAHIPDAEVLQDIRDTEAEIATMEQELAGLQLMPDRWSHMRADARVSGIGERREFVAKLRALLATRAALARVDDTPTRGTP